MIELHTTYLHVVVLMFVVAWLAGGLVLTLYAACVAGAERRQRMLETGGNPNP